MRHRDSLQVTVLASQAVRVLGDSLRGSRSGAGQLPDVLVQSLQHWNQIATQAGDKASYADRAIAELLKALFSVTIKAGPKGVQAASSMQLARHVDAALQAAVESEEVCRAALRLLSELRAKRAGAATEAAMVEIMTVHGDKPELLSAAKKEVYALSGNNPGAGMDLFGLSI
mmetsp:Transcript_9966/g.21280  ORF Transcript_9966/g.21280 Transcript_9966/m.21280 type:complete len:172 (+) Transcript_9966:3-518(+)